MTPKNRWAAALWGIALTILRIASRKPTGLKAFPHLNPHGRRRENAHNARKRAHKHAFRADGLRDTLAELGVDELIPELFETEFDDDGT